MHLLISLEKIGFNMGPVIPIHEISQELNFLIAFIIGIGLFYFSFLKARIKGTLINMGE